MDLQHSEREGVRNILSKKRQCSPTLESKTHSGMLIGLDILDCPICFEPLTSPIFQCDNGHLACSLCCLKLYKCPTCEFPVGHRCRAMENVLESIVVPCQNAKFGCTENISYGKELSHEKECTFSCSCPALDCSYTGTHKSVYSHFVDDHSQQLKSMSFEIGGFVDVQMNITRDKILVLRELKEKLLFVLHCFSGPYGVYMTVECIAPSTPEASKFAYRLSYSINGRTLTYKSREGKKVLEVSSQIPKDDYMFLPQCILRGELLEMKLCIGRNVCVD